VAEQERPDDAPPATRDDKNAFPRLEPDQIARAAAFGIEEALPSGTLIFETGQRGVDFFIVLKGRVEILADTPGTDQKATVHVHLERGFTGELDLFSGRKILVDGRLMTDDGSPGRVLRVPRDRFARLLSAEPDVGRVIIRAFILRRLGLIDHAQGGVLIVGHRESKDMLRLERFLKRNGYPMLALDPDTDMARSTMARHDIARTDLPTVVCNNGAVLRRPDNAAVADCLGLTEAPDPDKTYDVTIVGGGPAGLAAAVYAASEGLSTLVIEPEAPGGQAGTSSRIENYLGFPTGVSGWELAARAEHQAQRFGATIAVPRRAVRLEPCGGHDDPRDDAYRLHLDIGPPVRTRTVILASGARWRTLDLADASRFDNAGLHYAATAVEADLCGEKRLVVVGGGNSAGQAAVFLSGRADRVYLLVRGPNLQRSMSDYLIRRIELSDKIELLCDTRITGLEGDDWLRRVTWQTAGGEPVTRDLEHVFLMIGSTPNSDWLDGVLKRDNKGFVLTGLQAAGNEGHEPLAHETSLPGVFAVGDIRAGSVKRVASGVGEGSVCVAEVHQALARRRERLEILS
jgi:thioredoxin reductase (NADPH)